MSKAVIQARPGTPHRLLSPAFLLTAVAAFMLAIDNLVVVGGAFAAVVGYGNAATSSHGFRVAPWVGAEAAALAALLAMTLRLANESASA
jgi:hypothetical protein